MQITSKLIEKAVDEMASLPGIGRKTALRLILNLLKRDNESVKRFANSFLEMKEHISYCEECHNLSDAPLCNVCSNVNREQKLVCVVEDIRDVMAIESTQYFKGKYHVLGGVISPMDGIGPSDLYIEPLIEKIKSSGIEEVIMALSSTIEGDTTSYYIFKKIKDTGVKVTTIAKGVAIGDELEYTDEITLGRSIQNRLPYENSLAR